MNFLLILMSLSINTFAEDLNTNLYEDQGFSCSVTSENKRYDDVFVIEVKKEGYSSIRYKRKHLDSPAGEYGELEQVRGCYHAIQKANQYKSEQITVECSNDGEEGIFTISPDTLTGNLYFYMPKIGYPERVGLDVKCTRITK